ncbi:hypothetical protein NQZ79_g5055 [Umbelopsis isabellina]|nr:hypothetical protein NQZ79_g5055 [Umbelopsis isabellina]
MNRIHQHCAPATFSNLNISNMTQCVLELLYNALDAGARNITVEVNTETYFLVVSDNGRGIPSSEVAKLAQTNFTSKCQSWPNVQDVKTFGFRDVNDQLIRFGGAYNALDKLLRQLIGTNDALVKPNQNSPLYLMSIRTSMGTSKAKDLLEHYADESELANDLQLYINQYVHETLDIGTQTTNKTTTFHQPQKADISNSSGSGFPLRYSSKRDRRTEDDYEVISRKSVRYESRDNKSSRALGQQQEENDGEVQNDLQHISDLHFNRIEHQNNLPASDQRNDIFRHFPKIFRYEGLPETLSSDLLLNAKAIGQVDKKFIAFQTSGRRFEDDNDDIKTMIVLADQHAVDERILLEKMFKNLMDVVTSTPSTSDPDISAAGSILLSPPRKINLSPTEVAKAMRYCAFFTKWNIDYVDVGAYQSHNDVAIKSSIGESKHFRKLHSSSSYFQRDAQQPASSDGILVFKIPRIISDRCATNPALLKQIIFEHIDWLESQSSTQQPVEAHESRDKAESWNRRLRDCPRIIIEILKSKACRNAIMFNDALSKNECQKLIDLMSECVFPFQCAHGRFPNIKYEQRLSMVPMIKYNTHGVDQRQRQRLAQQPRTEFKTALHNLPSTPSMCGRFACSLGHEAVKQRLRENNLNPSEWVDEDKYEGTYNVAPTYFIPVVRYADNEYHLQSMRWGLIPFWSKTKPEVPTINARDDSLTDGKPMFRACRNDKRCIVIAEGYYEWLTPKSGGKKVPHYVKRPDGNIMLFAALYDHVKLEGSKDTIFSCTIVTTSCSKQLSFLHNRMPVIFDQNSPEVEAWLDNSKPWDNRTLGHLLRPYEKKLECSQNSLEDESESTIKKEDTEFYSQQRDSSPEDNTKSNIKLEPDIETELKMKSDDDEDDDDMKKAIALSLQDQDANGVSREGSLADDTSKGIKRGLESQSSPKSTKHRRIDPAKQMKSPPKNATKKEDDEKKSNQKITSFFGKS